MQPYFFPYHLYWKLISAVDVFVFLDDVNYKKKGFINRNFLNCQGARKRFGVSLNGASQNRNINEHDIVLEGFTDFKKIEAWYANAPFYQENVSWVSDLLLDDERNLSNYLTRQIIAIAKKLTMKTEFLWSSQIDPFAQSSGPERIISLCRQLQCETYINLPGGLGLYTADEFKKNDIQLKFLKDNEVQYDQPTGSFVPGLSIIDIILNVGTEHCASLLKESIAE